MSILHVHALLSVTEARQCAALVNNYMDYYGLATPNNVNFNTKDKHKCKIPSRRPA